MLKNDVPGFVASMKEMNELFEAEQPELDYLKEYITELINQLRVKTATYSLERWEQEFGLSLGTELPLTKRRARILAKLNSNEPATKAMLENLVKQILNAKSVRIKEIYDSYFFEIYVNTSKLIENLEVADEAIYYARPAYLGYKFINELIREAILTLYVGATGGVLKRIRGEVSNGLHNYK